MVLCRGPENPHVALQIGLGVGGHDATHRRPQLDDLDVLADVEGAVQSVIFDKPLEPYFGVNDHVGPKAAHIQLCILAGQGA